MSQSTAASQRTRHLAQAGLFVAAAGGGVTGMALHAGFIQGWSAANVGLLLGGFALVGLGLAIHQLAFRVPEKAVGLPGDVYGKGRPAAKAAKPAAKLEGRVPFSAGKRVTKRQHDPVQAKLYAQLEAINRQMQRAAVDLGLGQISQEGYTAIATDLKAKRGEVERRLARHERGRTKAGQGTGTGGSPGAAEA